MNVTRIGKSFGILILCLCCFLLCACEKEEAQHSVLWYQDHEAVICGVYTREGEEHTLTLTLGQTDPSGIRSVTLEYEKPESIAGIIFRRDGTVCTAAYDTVEIPLSEAAAAEIFAPAALFALDQQAVTEISSVKDGQTLIRLADGETSWEVYTDSEGGPLEIRAATADALYSFQITSFALTDQ